MTRQYLQRGSVSLTTISTPSNCRTCHFRLGKRPKNRQHLFVCATSYHERSQTLVVWSWYLRSTLRYSQHYQDHGCCDCTSTSHPGDSIKRSFFVCRTSSCA
ncbi:hypothetical protein SCP_0905150 [Sparassis crispa]|uniref:Uncharacterized protein n=1 Tax=Sparassis crispa TaxID=139825 RepID=A0A401GWN2_9APHY|nr:hypothetical protein SCP_0905150 [Sparassis crispa]GBE86636.1 hypothetical protein SCP_0905150 [Sparassis crispa]